jgi:hypothetical protein
MLGCDPAATGRVSLQTNDGKQPVVKQQFVAECQLAAFKYRSELRALEAQFRKELARPGGFELPARPFTVSSSP